MKLAVIVSQFPELHETFIAQELNALREAGIALRIYSLKRCRDRIVQPQARQLMDAVVYCSWEQPWVWFKAGLCLLRHPLRSLASLGWVVRHHAHPPLELIKALGVWWQSLALARGIRRDGFTRVHAHWATMPTTAAAVVSRLTGLPFAFTAHAWDIFVHNASLPEKLRLAQQVITCTAYNRDHLIRLCPPAQQKITLAYHGVDLKRFSPQIGGARGVPAPAFVLGGPGGRGELPLLLSVGRLVETKGFASLIDAYQLLHQRGVSFRAIIVGDGPLRQSLQNSLRAAGCDGAVELHGSMAQDELLKLYAQARAFVLPCAIAPNGDRDGIPNVILEAMAAGLPVVTTAVSGIPEAVEHEQTGLLLPSGDAPQLAGAIGRLLADESLARRMGAAGRQKAQAQFDAARHLQQLIAELKKPADERKTILYVIWSLAVGGAERVVSLLAQHLDAARYRAVVACLNAEGALAQPLKQAGIAVHALNKRGPLDVRVLWRLVALMRRKQVALVHAHLWGANVWGRLAAWLAGIPVVVTEHNTDTWKTARHLMLDRLFSRGTRRMVTVSAAVRDFYTARGIAGKKITVIPNGIETERFAAARLSPLYGELGWGVQHPVFVAIGRVVLAKRHERFIDAMAEVVAARPQARGLIAGDGPLRAQLQQRVTERGLQGKVVFCGVREDVPAVVRGARAVVFTSEREGLPMVALEAMAGGVPVVSTAVGGIPEVIEDGRTGWLIPQQGNEALVKRLVSLCDDPGLAARTGSAAQSVARSRFSLPAMLRAHEALYEEILRPPMGVAFIIDHLGAGGAQRQLYELARRLSPKRFSVRVIALSNAAQLWLEPFRRAGIAVECIAQSGKWDWGCLWRLTRELHKSRPQIVHTWLFTAGLYGKPAARLAGVPVVLDAVRSVDAGKPARYVLADRWFSRMTDAYTVNAQAIREALRHREGIADAKIHTITNGVDLAAFDPLRRNGRLRQQLGFEATQRVFGTVGRLSPEKDQPTFLQAAALIAKDHPQARFLIAGAGPLKGELKRLAVHLGIEQRLRVLAAPSEIADVFAAMDVFVLTSTYEGCSNVILEAMAMGKPVIATDVGGNPELVEPQQTGLLVPVAQPQALADAMAQLLADEQKARRFGEAGRRRAAERFSIGQMVERTIALYEQLLRRRRVC